MSFIKDNKAFTLVQLIITVAVISILAVSVFSALKISSRTGQAKDVQRYEAVTAIGKAVELYQLDNDALPADLIAANVDVDQKFVICSAGSYRTCDGQYRVCIIIDDTDFLGPYLGGALPIDPDKSSTVDTGYYIARSGDKMVFGACESYAETNIEYIARATMPSACGNGIVESDEVCDDGNLITEGCGNGILEDASDTYCNNICTATIETLIDEVCDYLEWTVDCTVSEIQYTVDDTSVDIEKACIQDCTIVTSACSGGGEG